MVTDKTKPAGIILVIVYSFILAIANLTSSISSISFVLLFGNAIWFLLLTVISIIWSIFLLTAIYGLWTIQSWGWKLAFGLYLVAIPICILSIFLPMPLDILTTINTVAQLVFAAIDIGILFYLFSVKIYLLYYP